MNLKKYVKLRKHPSGEEVEEEYGGSQSLERLDIAVTYTDLGTAPTLDLTTLDAGAVLNPSDILLGASVEVTEAFNDASAGSVIPEVDLGDPAVTGQQLASAGDALNTVLSAGVLQFGNIISGPWLSGSGAFQSGVLVQEAADPVPLFYGSGFTPLAGNGTAGILVIRCLIARAS